MTYVVYRLMLTPLRSCLCLFTYKEICHFVLIYKLSFDLTILISVPFSVLFPQLL
jgi:hypothetical protein